MSARVVTDQLIAAIESRQFDALICNFANGDMVGHTGNLAAATAAIEVLDECIGRLTTAIQAIGGELLITADHGNAETMHDPESNQPHTAHTLNPVPVVYLGRQARLRDDGSLQDIAPTLLAMMGVAQPAAMTGQSLIEFA
jgi:2,3-bisphosphoglycerate-independent phosphoglycerate mutase